MSDRLSNCYHSKHAQQSRVDPVPSCTQWICLIDHHYTLQGKQQCLATSPMLGHRLRRWPDIDLALDECLAFAVTVTMGCRID